MRAADNSILVHNRVLPCCDDQVIEMAAQRVPSGEFNLYLTRTHSIASITNKNTETKSRRSVGIYIFFFRANANKANAMEAPDLERRLGRSLQLTWKATAA